MQTFCTLTVHLSVRLYAVRFSVRMSVRQPVRPSAVSTQTSPSVRVIGIELSKEGEIKFLLQAYIRTYVSWNGEIINNMYYI